MDIEKLSFNKLTKEESEKWSSLKNMVKELCNKNVLEEYTQVVKEALMNVLIEDHIAGYSMEHGYYYVIEGDYGELTLACLTKDIKEMAFYILKSVYYVVASDIELKNRTIFQKSWLYYHVKNSIDDQDIWKKNVDAMYKTYYDPRKIVYEYVLNQLIDSFGTQYVESTIQEYEDYLNTWFADKHWHFNNNNRLFEEMSNSSDSRFIKGTGLR